MTIEAPREHPLVGAISEEVRKWCEEQGENPPERFTITKAQYQQIAYAAQGTGTIVDREASITLKIQVDTADVLLQAEGWPYDYVPWWWLLGLESPERLEQNRRRAELRRKAGWN